MGEPQELTLEEKRRNIAKNFRTLLVLEARDEQGKSQPIAKQAAQQLMKSIKVIPVQQPHPATGELTLLMEYLIPQDAPAKAGLKMANWDKLANHPPMLILSNQVAEAWHYHTVSKIFDATGNEYENEFIKLLQLIADMKFPNEDIDPKAAHAKRIRTSRSKPTQQRGG